MGEKNGTTVFAGIYITGSFQRQAKEDLRTGNTLVMMKARRSQEDY
jgi:hypothetical protein